MVILMSTATERSKSSERKINHKRLAVIIGGGLAVGLVAAGAVYGVNKYDEHEKTVEKANAKHAKILSDAHNAAVAVVEQQRLNPASIKVIGGLLIIKSDHILASSPSYLNIPSAPGNINVPKGKSIAVLNPIKVGNTYQFSGSCDPKPANKFITSEEIANRTYWISENATTTPKPSTDAPVFTIDKSSGEIKDADNLAVNCAHFIDVGQETLLEQLAGISVPNKLPTK